MTLKIPYINCRLAAIALAAIAAVDLRKSTRHLDFVSSQDHLHAKQQNLMLGAMHAGKQHHMRSRLAAHHAFELRQSMRTMLTAVSSPSVSSHAGSSSALPQWLHTPQKSKHNCSSSHSRDDPTVKSRRSDTTCS